MQLKYHFQRKNLRKHVAYCDYLKKNTNRSWPWERLMADQLGKGPGNMSCRCPENRKEAWRNSRKWWKNRDSLWFNFKCLPEAIYWGSTPQCCRVQRQGFLGGVIGSWGLRLHPWIKPNNRITGLGTQFSSQKFVWLACRKPWVHSHLTLGVVVHICDPRRRNRSSVHP